MFGSAEIGLFLLNVCVIMLCGITSAISGVLYIRERRKRYFYWAALAACYTAEMIQLLFISFSNATLIDGSSAILDHISYPAIRIILSSIILLLDFRILLDMLHKTWKKVYFLSVISYIVITTYAVLQPQTEVMIWLFYSMRQFYRMILILYYAIECIKIYIRKDEKKVPKYSTALIMGVVPLNICILIEDTVNISHIDFLVAQLPLLSEHNLSENILWSFLCICMLVVCISKLIEKSEVEQVSAAETVTENMDEQKEIPGKSNSIHVFGQQYHFTKREMEIFECMADYMNYSEICDNLYISMGTVKTHIHNIYQKTEVSNKNDLMAKLMEFRKVYEGLE